MAKTTRKKRTSVQVKEPRHLAVDPNTLFETGVPQPEPFEQDVRAYKLHNWVQACARVIASNFASVSYKAWRQIRGGEWEERPDNEFIRLMDRPNPWMTGYGLREFTILNQVLTGNAYWGLERDARDRVFEIWPLPAHLMRVVTSKESLVKKYILDVNGEQIEYDPGEIVHFKDPNPQSLIYGLGGVSGARLSITQDLFAQGWNKFFFQNNARPDSILETDQPLEPADRKAFRRAWEKMYRANENRGRTAILDNGLKYKEVNRSHKDMDFTGLRKMSREEILSVFGVPPVVVGIFEFANYANSREQIQLFWKHTIIPKTRSFADAVTLAQRRIPQLFDPGVIFEPDLSTVEALRVDEKNRADTAKVYVDMGVPPNQVISALDLPFDEFEGGDQSRQPSSSPLSLGAGAPPIKQQAIVPRERETEAAGAQGKADEAERRELRRVVAWKAFDEDLRRQEGSFEREMRTYFKAQARRVKRKFDDHAEAIVAGEVGGGKAITKNAKEKVDLIFDLEAEAALLELAAESKIRSAFTTFAKATAARINPGIDWSPDNEKVVAFVKGKALKLASDVTDVTSKFLDEEITEGIQQAVSAGVGKGEAISSISDRIDEVFQFSQRHRAPRIARTESIGAANAGNVEAIKGLGGSRKEWLSSRDGKVRDSHAAMDALKVGVDEPFVSPITGATLNFPGDSSAPAGEVVNCRCAVFPVKGDE